MDRIKEMQTEYKNKITNISNILKKNFFYPIHNNTNDAIKILSYDDMFYEMYFKKRYINEHNKNILNIENVFSGNIIKDLQHLLNKFDIKYFHDNKFKVSKYNSNMQNYFKCDTINNIMLYNSMDQISYQQSEFRKQLWSIENAMKTKYCDYYKNYNMSIEFYEDEKYDMIWIIVKIKKLID